VCVRAYVLKDALEDEKKPEILTHAEITQLIQKSYEDKHPWRYVWATALLTGMRSGELYALRWKDIDFVSKSISVTRSYNGKRQEFKSTKAGYWRQVPISSELEVVLREQHGLTRNEELVFERNHQWERGVQAKVLRQYCFAQGLPSIKFHALRACFATQMLRSGVEAARVMKICGWKDLKTMQCYVRLAGIEIEGATEALRFFGPNQSVDNVANIRHYISKKV
jgi:integrase